MSLFRPVVSRSAVRSLALPAVRSLGAEAFSHGPETKVTTLPSGLRVATETTEGETVTIGVHVDVGTRHEVAGEYGVAHFLEHMRFKGTPTRSRLDMEKAVENMGGHFNAYTSRESTLFYSQVRASDAGKTTDMMADMLKNTTFDAAAIDIERGVIMREAEEIAGMPEEVLIDSLHETAYQTCSLGRTILGTEEDIMSVSQDSLSAFVRKHYTAPNTVVAAAGAVEHEAVVDMVAASFDGLRDAPEVAVTPADAGAVFTGSDLRIREDYDEVSHIALAWETEGWTSADSFPLMVINELIGSWNSASYVGPQGQSRLSQAVAEGKMAHSFQAFSTTYADTGLTGLSITAGPQPLRSLMEAVFSEYVRLATTVEDAEVQFVKTKLLTNLLSLHQTSERAEDIARQMAVYGRRLTPAEVYTRLQAVDASAVRATARKFFYDNDFALAAIGPVFELPDYNELRGQTWSSFL